MHVMVFSQFMHMTEIYDNCMNKTVFIPILNVSCVYSKQIRNKENKMEKMCEEKRGMGGMLNCSMRDAMTTKEDLYVDSRDSNRTCLHVDLVRDYRRRRSRRRQT